MRKAINPSGGLISKIHNGEVRRIVETVRNNVLNWALDLERQGILGEGLRFSNEEVSKAANVTINYTQNVHGVLGNVSGNTVQIEDYSTIASRLDSADISPVEKEEGKKLLAEFQAAQPDAKRGIAARALSWLGRNY